MLYLSCFPRCRYLSPSAIQVADKLRDTSRWWEGVLAPLRSKAVAAGPSAGGGGGRAASSAAPTGSAGPAAPGSAGPKAAVQRAAAAGQASAVAHHQWLAAEREDRELEERAQRAKQGLPTTLDGFKAHSVYVLERHIGRYQALQPGAKKKGFHRWVGAARWALRAARRARARRTTLIG